jgi:uncharacterized protein YjbI with pentapeptide repeats
MAKSKGPKLVELEGVARQIHTVVARARFARAGGGTFELEARQTSDAQGTAALGKSVIDGRVQDWRRTATIADAMLALADKMAGQGELVADSVRGSGSKGAVSGATLTELCLAAWFEAFGQTPPAAEEVASQRAAKRAAEQKERAGSKALQKELLALLSGGPAGVKKWNSRFAEARALAPIRRADLAGLDLTGARLVDMPGAAFDGAILASADLSGRDFTKATFGSARLSEARLKGAMLKQADFRGADLTGADLAHAKLLGATFVGARLDGVQWSGAVFDAGTCWPDGSPPPEGLHWVGEGPNPSALAAIAARKQVEGPVDLKAFMKRLEASIEKARLVKALSMLKSERFQLFVEVSDTRLTGVVKSQSDPGLVYSCTLGAHGAFSCCTQNLNVCGGLRGALCKHLLVLVVGLAQAHEITPDTLDDWVQRSTLHKPGLDKETLGAVLLKYKGAEAGEIDWRPTETVPEDFYAY